MASLHSCHLNASPCFIYTFAESRDSACCKNGVYLVTCTISCAGLRAKDIDILVVNCSLFNPTPSLSAMIVNHFKMRSNVLSYNLAGVFCNSAHDIYVWEESACIDTKEEQHPPKRNVVLSNVTRLFGWSVQQAVC